MNRNIFYATALLLVLFGSCKKSGFDYQMYQPTLADIDSIYFSATDKMLIADGQAKLEFIVEAYRKVKLKAGRDSMMKIDINQLPAGSLKVMEERSGKEVGMQYSINSVAYDSVKFHAEIGQTRSSTKPVALVAKPALPSKLYVDVVFHVWELNTTHPTYDPSSYQPITYDQLKEALKYMNEVINNQHSHSPNGAASNVEFRLATKNQNGVAMIQPGFNKIVYSDNIKTNPLAANISQTDFINFINNNKPTYIWNPKNFLNLHILPYGSNNSMGNNYPVKQLAPQPGETAILGITGTAANEDDYVLDYANATCGLPRTLFFPGYERKMEIFGILGRFYGLYPPTYNATRQYSDFCYDTRKFDSNNPRNSFSFALKVGIDNEKYVADNVMDDSRYPTLANSISKDQVARMRAVMTRCPGRMNAKPQ